MKNSIFIAVLFLLTVILVSCTFPYSFMHGELDVDTIRIEIVNLETDIGNHTEYSYYAENISVVKIIDSDKNEEFLSDFEEIKSYQPIFGSRIDSISGVAVRIIYENGDIELITDNGTATVRNGEIRTLTTTFDSDAFSELIVKYS